MTNEQLKICENLKKSYPDPKCELEYKSPFEILVAVILSAQCTDKRVNMVTKNLFQIANNAKAMIELKQENLEKIIMPCGFYHNKAKNIISASRDLVQKYNGEVPNDFDKLVELDGVGEKTASVVLAVAFNVPALAVDTHVLRLSNRLGFVNNLKDPHKVSVELKKIIPKNDWIDFHYSLVLHGRYVCKAIKPQCHICSLREDCKYYRGKKDV